MKFVIVPRSDINRVEEARHTIHTILENIEDPIIREKLKVTMTFQVTGKLWHLTHSNYDEYKESLLHKILKYIRS